MNISQLCTMAFSPRPLAYAWDLLKRSTESRTRRSHSSKHHCTFPLPFTDRKQIWKAGNILCLLSNGHQGHPIFKPTISPFIILEGYNPPNGFLEYISDGSWSLLQDWRKICLVCDIAPVSSFRYEQIWHAESEICWSFVVQAKCSWLHHQQTIDVSNIVLGIQEGKQYLMKIWKQKPIYIINWEQICTGWRNLNHNKEAFSFACLFYGAKLWAKHNRFKKKILIFIIPHLKAWLMSYNVMFASIGTSLIKDFKCYG